MVDKYKVPKSRNYITEWPFVPWPFVGGLLSRGFMSGWPLVRTPGQREMGGERSDPTNPTKPMDSPLNGLQIMSSFIHTSQNL